MQTARVRYEAQAALGDARTQQRAELLRLRFEAGLPIREIAARWQGNAAQLHREYARARREFRQALEATVTEEEGGSVAEVQASCARLMRALAG
jgi:RNA polymerase sigma-70 factor (ECF subfamily)